MNKPRLCLIGAGFHASTNIFPSAIEAGAEINMLHEVCDGVVGVAQPHDQTSLVLDCINAGKNVYVDRPLGWNASEAA